MPSIDVYNIEGKKVDSVNLSEEIFGIEPNEAVVHSVLVNFLANQRQGTQSTKTRAEVRGGGRKPWRQKGTGRARQGSIRAAQWYHGGIVFGPHNRSYDKKMNRKERRLALKSALAYKSLESKLVVVDSFNLETNKTSEAKSILKQLTSDKNILIVVEELNDNLILATRNLKNVVLLQTSEINTYDIIAADTMIITSDAVKTLEEVLG